MARIIALWSKVCTYSFKERLRFKRDVIYTLWIKNFIGSMGERSIIKHPCSLQGDGLKQISLGHDTCLAGHCILGSWSRYEAFDGLQHFDPEIIIGNYCSIGEYAHITATNRITIGDGVLTGRYVYIGDNSHGELSLREAEVPPARRPLKSKGEIKIGKNVWIGDKVTVLGGVTIGDNVIIGANSVVTHDVMSNCVVVGIPAKVVKHL